jgi:hypothetical protein
MPRETTQADYAIREARAGRLSLPKMLSSVLAAKVFVPLASLPLFENNSIKKWNPATVTKRTDGLQFLIVFSDDLLCQKFLKSNQQYSHGLLIDSKWVLNALPPNHGIAFNPGGPSSFDWSAIGIEQYKREHTR